MTIVLAGARTSIDVSAPPVATGGFLAAANVIDLPEGDHALMGAQYTTDACTFAAVSWTGAWCAAGAIAAQCVDPVSAPVAPKGFAGAWTTTVTGDPFVLYSGSQCDIKSISEQLASATASFNYGERRGVDAAMAAWLNSIDTVVNDTPVSIGCLVGNMESWLAGIYGGVGLLALAIPAVVEGIGLGYLRSNGNSITTVLGTPVAAYAPATAAASYDAWALGQLTLLRGPLASYSVPPMQRPDGTCEPARALAERIYVPLVECAVGKFESTCCDCAGTTP